MWLGYVKIGSYLRGHFSFTETSWLTALSAEKSSTGKLLDDSSLMSVS